MKPAEDEVQQPQTGRPPAIQSSREPAQKVGDATQADLIHDNLMDRRVEFVNPPQQSVDRGGPVRDEVLILKLAKTLEIEERIEVEGCGASSPIYANGTLYLRSARRLHAIAGGK